MKKNKKVKLEWTRFEEKTPDEFKPILIASKHDIDCIIRLPLGIISQNAYQTMMKMGYEFWCYVEGQIENPYHYLSNNRSELNEFLSERPTQKPKSKNHLGKKRGKRAE